MQRNELTDGTVLGQWGSSAGGLGRQQKTRFISEPIFSGITRVWALGRSDEQRMVSYSVCGSLAPHTSQAPWEELLSPKSMMLFKFVFFFF